MAICNPLTQLTPNPKSKIQNRTHVNFNLTTTLGKFLAIFGLTAQESLEMLRKKQPELFKANTSSEDLKRLMILLSPNQLELADYDPEEAFLRVNRHGLPLVPFWGEMIHQRLRENLEGFSANQ